MSYKLVCNIVILHSYYANLKLLVVLWFVLKSIKVKFIDITSFIIFRILFYYYILGRDLCKQVPKENVNISTSDEKDSIQPLLSKSVEEFTLPENILSKLYESEKIVKLLKSKKLQDLLKYIASADDKEEILRNQMKNNEDFNEFVDLLLEQIGVRKDGMSILS